MSTRVSRRRSSRQASRQHRSVYVEPDTDDDLQGQDSDDYEESDRPLKRQRRQEPTASSRSDELPPAGAPQTRSKAAHSATPKKQASRRASPVKLTIGAQAIQHVTARINGSRSGKTRKRRGRLAMKGPTHSSQKITQAAKPAHSILTDGIRPTWHLLPYEILLSIFSFAYGPESGSHNWLLKAASRSCRAFAEPALSAFYQNPRLPTAHHLERLFELVHSPQDRRYINYQTKVKQLEIDINAFTLHKDTSDSFDFSSLIECLPQLEEIFVTSVQDKPPYRRHAPPRWKYSEAWFDALLSTNLRLKSWRWNWLFVRQGSDAPRLFDLMFKTHQSATFQNITHLEICDHPDFVAPADGPTFQEDKIAEAIALLPKLKSLELETCDIVNARFLERLPKSLVRLRLANCEALTSEAVETYLSQDGGCQLEELVLDHNVRLNLAFMPLLRANCLKLKRLSMDLHYYSQHHTVNDAEARYAELLNDNDIPTWPGSLESVELLHLQKCSATAAQNLFTSLVDSASDLANLRHIVLHAHISISWRDRVSFREKWFDRLRKVYLKPSVDPNPSLASLKAFRVSRDVNIGSLYDTPAKLGRRLSAVSIPKQAIDETEFSSHDSDEPTAQSRRSRRIAASEVERTQRIARQARRRMSVSSSSNADENADDETFVQGLCHVVDIRIDNQRPREEQLNESHFLDSEESGDEDWTEGQEMPDERYAW